MADGWYTSSDGSRRKYLDPFLIMEELGDSQNNLSYDRQDDKGYPLGHIAKPISRSLIGWGTWNPHWKNW